MDNKTHIINFCKELGISEVGFCRCENFYELERYLNKRKNEGVENEFEEKDINKRINPNYYMEEGKTIISIAFPYSFYLHKDEEMYFSLYTRGKDYHKVVSNYLEKVCEFIIKIGGKAKYFVDSNALPERYIACKSGIGFIGKNNMLINKKYGSYIFLGEIITNLSIEPDEPCKNQCGECERCIKACPTKSINKYFNNPNICLSYITQKKDIEDKWFEKFNGRLFGCDTCQLVCPFNYEVKYSEIDDFKPLEFMNNVNLYELISIDNKIFREKYKITSCGWRGKNIIQRNALINFIMKKNENKMHNLEIVSPYVREYFNRLLNFNKL
ncbi:epoxyqueuosine reductase [Clostridium pasteurianum DSM 525 = ATCC 6013]|uniref:Epoxyqueuosine reductase n=1 Tax=Clostridium pasteurianum DSM 525 = ATCC 6013 TaxID=1262449 RepID=A0A0H3J8M7_CLOPA|nr:tRNA epoxyqueuosine(34) reductase QueG [Clostridium pasteurianum]AJA47425.1 epoxyqueuosine reductase [Clostridium pasteurianum DSM 525 = ATCC 6013]AJA51413.1 epoxyqueuosine reductase [Clostridium pasteurianum DSM 525 = ATCC 6013]AOZ74752.1 epoxyqueuosine reductase [Clostridium pasteurianum DSM 525 = ATCC 6013]AOZ78548.1 epoxyqueuosine reductase [Clostridium pasteurianum]ELP58760.1 iron-sulfur cluster-binding protein [Clostridium pasteurianum DSM 525 = ATCC 6013]